MTERSSDPTTNFPLNPPDPPLEEKQRQLQGERRVEDQAAFIDISDTDSLGYETAMELYEGEPGEELENEGTTESDSMELLTELELRADETDDVMEAVEEGYTYVPPIDPPIVPGRDGNYENAEVASGLGVSSLDEPYDEDHHSDFLPTDDDMSARVRDALRADSSTSAYADRITVITRDGVVTLRGVVDDLVDSDNLAAVAEYVEGVEEVIDETRVRSLE